MKYTILLLITASFASAGDAVPPMLQAVERWRIDYEKMETLRRIILNASTTDDKTKKMICSNIFNIMVPLGYAKDDIAKGKMVPSEFSHMRMCSEENKREYAKLKVIMGDLGQYESQYYKSKYANAFLDQMIECGNPLGRRFALVKGMTIEQVRQEFGEEYSMEKRDRTTKELTMVGYQMSQQAEDGMMVFIEIEIKDGIVQKWGNGAMGIGR